MGVDPVTLAFMAVSTGISLYGTSKARKEARQFQKEGIVFDARTARLEGKAIVEEAELQAKVIEREGVMLGKTQKALTAKAGVEIGTGTAQEIQEQTRFLTAKDISTVLESAQRQKTRLEETFPDPVEQMKIAAAGGGTPVQTMAKLKALQGGKSLTDISAPTALEGGSVSKNSNFIQSKDRNNELAIVGL